MCIALAQGFPNFWYVGILKGYSHCHQFNINTSIFFENGNKWSFGLRDQEIPFFVLGGGKVGNCWFKQTSGLHLNSFSFVLKHEHCY